MPTVRDEPVLRFIRTIAIREQFARLPDAELLQRFVAAQDEEAFAALVCRHGPMVLRVCRQILANEHHAEDAFQATFLILSRKASSVKKQKSVGSWLFGVANYTSTNLKRNLMRRCSLERQAIQRSVADPLSALTLREAQAIVNQELAQLPEKYRAPLVLCSLEGLTRDEAAQQLGLPLGTLKSRLEQARKRLRVRLTARGLTLSGAFVVSLLGERMASAAIPAGLLNSTVQAATSFAAVKSAASIASAQVAALTEGVIRAMFKTSLKNAMVVLLLSAFVLGIGAGVISNLALAQNQKPAAKQPEQRDTDGDRKTTVVVTPSHHVTSQEWYLTKLDGERHTISVSDRGKGQLLTFHKDEATYFINGMTLDGLAVAKDAKVVIDGEARSFSDLKPGMRLSFRMAEDKPLLTKIHATTLREAKALYVVKSVDAAKDTITLAVSEKRPIWGGEWVFSVIEFQDKDAQFMTLPVAKDAKIRREWQEVKDGVLAASKSQDIKLADLKAGSSVALELAVVDGRFLVKSIMISK